MHYNLAIVTLSGKRGGKRETEERGELLNVEGKRRGGNRKKLFYLSCVLCCAQALSRLLTGENTEFTQQVVLAFFFFF